jgi:hypothetical protein
MSVYLLVALFVTATVASAATLADAAVRGRNAFRLLRGDLARLQTTRRVTVTFVDVVAEAPAPARRAVSAVRSSPRRTVRAGSPQPLRAAA